LAKRLDRQQWSASLSRRVRHLVIANVGVITAVRVFGSFPFVFLTVTVSIEEFSWRNDSDG
jgi:hypothetical protein